MKGTPRKGILFKRGEGLTLEACTNANYARFLVDRRSTSSCPYEEISLLREAKSRMFLQAVCKLSLEHRLLGYVSFCG